VTNDVSGAVKAAKSGRVDFKIDKTAIVHVGLGKVGDICTNANMPTEFMNRTRATLHIAILCHASLLFVLFLKVNFSEESLRENIGAFVNALLLAKPVGLKKSKWSWSCLLQVLLLNIVL
jgi:ribosomal protein L1